MTIPIRMTTIATTMEMEIVCFFSMPQVISKTAGAARLRPANARVPRAMRGQSQIARCVRTLDITGSNFVSLVLKELVNRESETDHRKSGPDPRHERSFRCNDRALVGQIGSLFGKNCSPIFSLVQQCSWDHPQDLRQRSSRSRASAQRHQLCGSHVHAAGPSPGATSGTKDPQWSRTANTRKTNDTSTATSVTGKRWCCPSSCTAIRV